MNTALPRQILMGAFAFVTSTMLLATDVAAQTLSTGAEDSATLKAGARYRNFGGSGAGGAKEVWLGTSPVTEADNFHVTWTSSNTVTLTYDGALLKTTVGSTPFQKSVGSLGPLNYVEISVVKSNPNLSVALNGIALNGGPVLGNAVLNGPAGNSLWRITGADLANGFSLTATLAQSGQFGGGDSSYVQIEVGHLAPADNQGPLTSSVVVQPQPVYINGTVTVTANVDDSTKGNNNIQSAQYSLNGGTWNTMTAQDGSFNSPSEDVTASFTALQLGANEVCIKGTDSVGNEGAAVCQSFLVTYKFSGFFSPIDNDFVNTVNAGQGIPAKWRLTDANDVPIDDPVSFVSLSSYLTSCTDFSGDPLDSIEEVSAGSSGLQYIGDGYWQFNWKTPKTYANSCRAMYVEFNSGATSPVAKFKFKK